MDRAQPGMFVAWSGFEVWSLQKWTRLRWRDKKGTFDKCVLRHYHVSLSVLMFWVVRKSVCWKKQAANKSRPRPGDDKWHYRPLFMTLESQIKRSKPMTTEYLPEWFLASRMGRY